MSSFQAIGLASAIFIPTVFFFYYLAAKANDAAIEIYTGVVKGVSVPAKQRWIWLYQVYVAYALGIVVVSLVVALALFQVAEGTTDSGASMVGYAYAFVLAIGALGTLFNALLGLLALASHLKSVERPSGDERT
jgi:hypothetical protein